MYASFVSCDLAILPFGAADGALVFFASLAAAALLF